MFSPPQLARAVNSQVASSMAIITEGKDSGSSKSLPLSSPIEVMPCQWLCLPVTQFSRLHGGRALVPTECAMQGSEGF